LLIFATESVNVLKRSLSGASCIALLLLSDETPALSRATADESPPQESGAIEPLS
jgi:hypothetical protein